MNRENLILVRDYLRYCPNNFNLNFITEGTAESVDEWMQALKTYTCGTTACVVGMFPFIFPDKFEYWLSELPYKTPATATKKAIKCRVIGSPSNEEKDGGFDEFINQTQSILGITSDQWEYLFEPFSYPFKERSNPLAVVSRINKILDVTADLINNDEDEDEDE